MQPDASTTTDHDRARREPGAEPRLALELLVHGVGGTTPQEMLGDPATVRVTGDDTAGIHRRTADADAESHPQDYRGRAVPEAYVWSNLTSGNASRALWLILLPFMVANLAHWMRPSVRGGSPSPTPDGATAEAATGASTGAQRTAVDAPTVRSAEGGALSASLIRRRLPTAVRTYGVLVRLVALSLTVLLVAAVCEVALDLTAWQCAGTAACSRDKSWLGFLSAGHGGWWSQPGRRLALAAAFPAALTGLLWWLSHRTWSDYESQPPPGRPVCEEDLAAGDRPALCLPGFWYGRRLVARLRAAHTATGFLTAAAALTAAATRHDRRPGGSAALDTLGWLLVGLLVSGGAFVVWVVCHRGRSESLPDDRIDRAAVSLLPGAALGVLVLAAVHAAWSRPDWTSAGPLPGDETFSAVAVVQGLLVVALACTARSLHRRAPDPRAALRGLAGPAVALLACALGGVLSGGVAQRVADWLDGPDTPGMDGPLTGPPVVLSWQAAVIPVLLVVLAAVVGYFAGRTWRISRRERRLVPARYPGEPLDTSRTRKIAGTIARAELTDAAPWLVAATALMTILLGGAAVAGAWATGEVPGRAAEGMPAPVEAAAQTAQALGSWMMGLGFVLLVAFGRRAYRDASARRTIGILWDVGTFWPRAAHPFAPPCYAERAVPDLTWRMSTWTERTGGRLVISGHSQGSVLAASAVWQLPPDTRGRVALLTYGSPIERLYGRWFPAYFGPEPLLALHREVDCWRNLWRRTDPIGGPVLLPDGAGPAVDRGPLKDPLAYGRTLRHPLPEPINGHSDYQADPAFAEERAGLLARLPNLPEQRGGPPSGAGPQEAETSGNGP